MRQDMHKGRALDKDKQSRLSGLCPWGPGGRVEIRHGEG